MGEGECAVVVDGAGVVRWSHRSLAGRDALTLAARAQDECATCHEDVAKAFAKTGHGRQFAGDARHQSANCVSCHQPGMGFQSNRFILTGNEILSNNNVSLLGNVTNGDTTTRTSSSSASVSPRRNACAAS